MTHFIFVVYFTLIYQSQNQVMIKKEKRMNKKSLSKIINRPLFFILTYCFFEDYSFTENKGLIEQSDIHSIDIAREKLKRALEKYNLDKSKQADKNIINQDLTLFNDSKRELNVMLNGLKTKYNLTSSCKNPKKNPALETPQTDASPTTSGSSQTSSSNPSGKCNTAVSYNDENGAHSSYTVQNADGTTTTYRNDVYYHAPTPYLSYSSVDADCTAHTSTSSSGKTDNHDIPTPAPSTPSLPSEPSTPSSTPREKTPDTSPSTPPPASTPPNTAPPEATPSTPAPTPTDTSNTTNQADICTSGTGSTAIQFSGYQWTVRNGHGGPGSNQFDPKNVCVDSKGHLHLKITQAADKSWHAAEIDLTQSLGFGTYQFEIEGQPDRLDDNITLGFFNYGGQDGKDEIDIEFSGWGKNAPHLNYTVYPDSQQGGTKHFQVSPKLSQSDHSTHRFHWGKDRVHFQSLDGTIPVEDPGKPYFEWENTQDIPHRPLPLLINLWIVEGKSEPAKKLPVEVIISKFTFKADQ
jgi:Glycosyl hydrolases family 16